MKHLFPKLIFIIFLVIGISSFVFLKKTNVPQEKEDIGNVRFNSEMENGFADRESWLYAPSNETKSPLIAGFFRIRKCLISPHPGSANPVVPVTELFASALREAEPCILARIGLIFALCMLPDVPHIPYIALSSQCLENLPAGINPANQRKYTNWRNWFRKNHPAEQANPGCSHCPSLIDIKIDSKLMMVTPDTLLESASIFIKPKKAKIHAQRSIGAKLISVGSSAVGLANSRKCKTIALKRYELARRKSWEMV